MTTEVYLSRELDTARLALRNTVCQLKQDATRAAHVGPWAAFHPWLLMGAATVAGFGLSAAMFRQRGRCRGEIVGSDRGVMRAGDRSAGDIGAVHAARLPSWLWIVTTGAIQGMARMAALRAVGIILTGRRAVQRSAQPAPDNMQPERSISAD